MKRLIGAPALVLVALLLSSCEYIMPLITPDPATPGNLTASQGDYAAYVQLTWNAAANAAEYRVLVSDTDGGTTSRTLSDITGNSVQDTALESGTHYWYRVVAINSANETSKPSGYVEGWAGLAAPQNLTASTTYPDRIALSWDAVTDAGEYYIYQNTAAEGTYTRLGTDSTFAETTVSVINVTPEVPYYYKVSAVDASQNEGALSEYAQGMTVYLTLDWDDSSGAYYQWYTNDPTYLAMLYYTYWDSSLADGGAPLTAKATKVSGAPAMDYGLVFGLTEVDDTTNYYYYFAVNTEGQYAVYDYGYSYADEWAVYTGDANSSWVSSSYLNSGLGTENELQVSYWYGENTQVDPAGNYYHYFLSANGQSLFYLYNASPIPGYFGFAADVGDSATEDLVASPVDVRFTMTSPDTLPSVVGGASARQALSVPGISLAKKGRPVAVDASVRGMKVR